MSKDLFTIKEFGTQNAEVIFFFAGMGTRTWLYAAPIKRLVKHGYHVIAYDFDPMIVRNGDSEHYLEVGEKVSASVKQYVKQLKTGGTTKFYTFGTSMGTLLAIKCAAEIPEVSKVVINMTYGSVAENIWTWWFIKPAKHRAIAQGYSLEELDRRLASISPIPNATKLKGKQVLLYLSRKDRVIRFEQSSQFKDALDAAGVSYSYIENKRRGHFATGYTNLKRYKTYLEFLKD